MLDALCTSMSISKVRVHNATNSFLSIDDAKERKRQRDRAQWHTMIDYNYIFLGVFWNIITYKN